MHLLGKRRDDRDVVVEDLDDRHHFGQPASLKRLASQVIGRFLALGVVQESLLLGALPLPPLVMVLAVARGLNQEGWRIAGQIEAPTGLPRLLYS